MMDLLSADSVVVHFLYLHVYTIQICVLCILYFSDSDIYNVVSFVTEKCHLFPTYSDEGHKWINETVFSYYTHYALNTIKLVLYLNMCGY